MDEIKPSFFAGRDHELIPLRELTTSLDAVILDWAGTTIDMYCDAPVVAFQHCYAGEGVPISLEEARKPMGNGKKRHIELISQDSAVRERWVAVHGANPTGDDIDRMFAAFVPAQMEALPDYKDLIPGALDAVAYCKKLGMKVGSTTGYTGEMVKLLIGLAAEQGYSPDVSVTTDEVGVREEDGSFKFYTITLPAGRPEPWMCMTNAMYLGIRPPRFHTVVKVDDTIAGIQEGLNAGMWSVGLYGTGNEMQMSKDTARMLSASETKEREDAARAKMISQTRAHYVIRSIADLPDVIDSINRRLIGGVMP